MGQPMHAARRTQTGHGWLVFAGVMFLVAAAFNAVYGISALVNDDYFAADELLFGDLSMWGALYLAFAALQLITALLIFNRSSAGAVIGVGLALLHGIAVLMSIGAYPVWSIILLVIDGMIIYGLTVYGFDEETA
jgi:hypothetical protein